MCTWPLGWDSSQGKARIRVEQANRRFPEQPLDAIDRVFSPYGWLVLDRSDVDPALVASGEVDDAGLEGEQSVVPTTPDVLAGMEARTALTHQDRAGVDGLTGETFDAQSLGM